MVNNYNLNPMYEQYFTETVEKPLQKQRAEALKKLYEEQASRGILKSGVGMYPIINLEKNLQDILGREGSKIALSQLQQEERKQELERQRQFQREMIEQQVKLQREMLEEQKRQQEQGMWGQLGGALLGTILGVPFGQISNILGEGITRLISPSQYNRQRMLEDLMMQYYQNLLGGQGTQTVQPTQNLLTGLLNQFRLITGRTGQPAPLDLIPANDLLKGVK